MYLMSPALVGRLFPTVPPGKPSFSIDNGNYLKTVYLSQLPHPGTETESPALQVDSLSTEPPEKVWGGGFIPVLNLKILGLLQQQPLSPSPQVH